MEQTYDSTILYDSMVPFTLLSSVLGSNPGNCIIPEIQLSSYVSVFEMLAEQIFLNPLLRRLGFQTFQIFWVFVLHWHNFHFTPLWMGACVFKKVWVEQCVCVCACASVCACVRVCVCTRGWMSAYMRLCAHEHKCVWARKCQIVVFKGDDICWRHHRYKVCLLYMINPSNWFSLSMKRISFLFRYPIAFKLVV